MSQQARRKFGKAEALIVAGTAVLLLLIVGPMFFQSENEERDETLRSEQQSPVLQSAEAEMADASTARLTSGRDSVAVVPDEDAAGENVAGDFEPRATLDESVAALEGEAYLEPEWIAALIEQAGGDPFLVYSRLEETHRENLLEYLFDEEQLRDHLAELLYHEQNTDLRAFMLNLVDPEGLYDPDAPLDGTLDPELASLIRGDASTEMGSDEWIARLELANLLNDQLALEMARTALSAGPDDPAVRLLAHSMTINLSGSMADEVSASERVAARDALMSELSATAGSDMLTPDERIGAYYALYFAPDGADIGAFYQQQLSNESDPRVRHTIQRLLELE